MKKVLALVLTLMLTLTAFAYAETFKMGIDAEYPPYTYMNEEGNYTGFDVEMCQKVCEILNWDLEIVPINWDTKLASLDIGDIDCIWSGLTIDVISPEEYTLSFAYCDSSQKILTTKSAGINTLADLAGKKVGVQLGTSADIMLQEDQAELAATFGALNNSYPDYNVCFTDLQMGEIDAIAIDASIGSGMIAKYGDEFFFLDEDLASEQYGICFRLADTEMCAKVEEAIMQLVADGTYQALAEKYAPEGLDVNALCLKAE